MFFNVSLQSIQAFTILAKHLDRRERLTEDVNPNKFNSVFLINILLATVTYFCLFTSNKFICILAVCTIVICNHYMT